VSKCPKMVVSRHISLKCGSFASLTPGAVQAKEKNDNDVPELVPG
jgi:hypothetical protein